MSQSPDHGQHTASVPVVTVPGRVGGVSPPGPGSPGRAWAVNEAAVNLNPVIHRESHVSRQSFPHQSPINRQSITGPSGESVAQVGSGGLVTGTPPALAPRPGPTGLHTIMLVVSTLPSMWQRSLVTDPPGNHMSIANQSPAHQLRSWQSLAHHPGLRSPALWHITGTSSPPESTGECQ